MKFLTRREELILLSIGNLKEDAYLVAIREQLSEIMGKKWSISTIHIPLRRLEKSGFVDSYYGDATAIRGGRRKKIYKITQAGMEALTEYKKVNDILWAKFVDFEYSS
jgi:DNA-binding PadR family transcriptional regulator